MLISFFVIFRSVCRSLKLYKNRRRRYKWWTTLCIFVNKRSCFHHFILDEGFIFSKSFSSIVVDTLINALYKSIRTGIIKKKLFLIIMSIYFIISWVHVVDVIQRKKNENKNDFTIDFFNLTRHFLLTQMKIKAAVETISQQIIQNQQK